MLRIRVMPCLLLSGRGLVKTVRFRSPSYVGDPVNTVRIFNELEVDELVLLDIGATPEGREIQYGLLEEIAGECFMPFAYGGGVGSVEDAGRLFEVGAEKVVVNSTALENPDLITGLAKRFGSQAVVVSIDVKKDFFGRYRVFGCGGRSKSGHSPELWARRMEECGAGEILLTAIDREGTFGGYDTTLIRMVSDVLEIPVIANGGASCVEDFKKAVHEGGASALAAGSMVVYQGAGKGVLTNFPARKELNALVENEGGNSDAQ